MTWNDAEALNGIARELASNSVRTDPKDIPGRSVKRGDMARNVYNCAMKADFHSSNVGEWLDYMADALIGILRAAGEANQDIGAEVLRKVGR